MTFDRSGSFQFLGTNSAGLVRVCLSEVVNNNKAFPSSPGVVQNVGQKGGIVGFSKKNSSEILHNDCGKIVSAFVRLSSLVYLISYYSWY